MKAKTQPTPLKLKARQKRGLMIRWIKRHWHRMLTVVAKVTVNNETRQITMLVGLATKHYLAGEVNGIIAKFKWSQIKIEKAATDDGFKFNHVAAL